MDLVPKVTSFLTLVFIALSSLEPVVCIRHWQLSSQPLVDEHLVTNLPGQPDVSFKHYAGYLTVNEQSGRALFYWFYEATTHPDKKPLVLWLNGEANMLFLESPVGVGFSYSNTTSDYNILGDEFTANDAYAFLHKWFLLFPSYRSRAFYIAGESYAGKYVPELAELINDKNNDTSRYIDLKGILLGNPETSDAEDWRGMVDYAWSHAIISDETHKIIRQSCNFDSNDPWSNDDCAEAVDELLKQYKEIDIYSLYTSVCIGDSASSDDKFTQIMFTRSSKMMPRIMGGYDPCLDEYAKAFYNRPDVQKALHVSDGHHLKNWSICNTKIFVEWLESRPSVLPIYKKLITAGLRIWVYSGDTDGRVPVLSTRYSLSSLGLPITKAWRPWYHKKEVSGWFQEYEGLTFATFRGAGHAVPLFKPSDSLAFFSAFLLGESLPSVR
ncbi:serine carboxypeptidase-like 31 isoform X2 [Populus alba]|uniref:serine carboxypeptidase-like 31 isoform X2 n=1 Tax=Populus alba TaxID=43335 RepID=UPI00158C54D6|nr:serine carboxypeptidase-like 31 isoform X2 [Populus alba]